MSRRLLTRAAPLLLTVPFGIAAYLLHRELANYSYREIRQALAGIAPARVVVALVLTAASYLVLTGYDALALRYLRKELPYRRTALASFVGYVFSHNIGLSVLGGAAPRYRLYSAWQLSTGEIATLVGFATLTFWIGSFTVGGLALVSTPRSLSAAVHLPPSAAMALGIALLAAVAAYVAATALRRTPLRVRGYSIPLPPASIALGQIAVSSTDWAVAAAVLYALLPQPAPVSYGHFLGLFVAAEIAGLTSHVPGGLGVFESVILLALHPHANGASLAGSLVAFRVVYYLLPLLVAVALFGAHEALERRAGLARFAGAFGRFAPEVAPRALALAVFAAGVLLLWSGATPARHSRLALLHDLLPLTVLETSHFLGSLVGLGLLVLAGALQRRLDVAYHLSVLLLAAGIVFSLLKGLDYEAALVLACILASLIPCRRQFYRRASILEERFSAGWNAAVVTGLFGIVLLGLFAHRHTEYAHELWWQFELHGDAPRTLRAGVGVLTIALLLATTRLLRPARLAASPPDAASLQRARSIASTSPSAGAQLALLGDKSFLFSDDGRAFVMYGVAGRSYVALGDPIGPRPQQVDLAWRFRELADRDGVWPVFYEVGEENLSLYLDLGLRPLKFGEEARVDLRALTLEGGARKEQRHLLRHVEREGGVFEILPAEQAAPRMSELEQVSNAWLRDKNTREKAFSLGAFVPEYLRNFPVAVLRREGRIVAFANVLLAADHEELSPDLMRYGPGAPSGSMEYLFLQLMLWGKREGFRWFNLGMAPLSGLESRNLAPMWHRIGAFVFRHGEHFYNFEGLRQYKEKFDPAWRPRYLVCPQGFGVLPRVLSNVAALVSGGLKGVVAR
jgi:phosphatidylglycerol lysyltransferase